MPRASAGETLLRASDERALAHFQCVHLAPTRQSCHATTAPAAQVCLTSGLAGTSPRLRGLRGTSSDPLTGRALLGPKPARLRASRCIATPKSPTGSASLPMTVLRPIPALDVHDIEPPSSLPPASCVPATVMPSPRPVPEGAATSTGHDASPGFVAGTRLGIVVSCGSSRQLVEHVKRRFESLGATAELLVPAETDRRFDDRTEIEAAHTLDEKPAMQFDFLVVLPGLETPPPLLEGITQWAHSLRDQAKPFAIGAQAAKRLGVDIDNAAVFDVSTCDAFVEVCKSAARAREATPHR